jgi:hypothetical protein
MSQKATRNKTFKKSYVLSCMGSLRKRKSSLEGKLRAMFARENVGDWESHVNVKPGTSKVTLPDSSDEEEEKCEREKKEEEVVPEAEKDKTGEEERMEGEDKTERCDKETETEGRISKKKLMRDKRRKMRCQKTGEKMREREKFAKNIREVFANARKSIAREMSKLE